MEVIDLVVGAKYEGGEKKKSIRRITSLSATVVWFAALKKNGEPGRLSCWHPSIFAQWAKRRLS